MGGGGGGGSPPGRDHIYTYEFYHYSHVLWSISLVLHHGHVVSIWGFQSQGGIFLQAPDNEGSTLKP